MQNTPISNPPAPPLVVEAALLCAGRALSLDELVALFNDKLTKDEVGAVVRAVGEQWAKEGRGFELAGDDKGWRVRTQAQMAEQLERLEPRGRQKYSSAVLETLAVIAYLQPVTRTIIEEHRKRAVTPGVLEQLLERGWVDVIGHQESPGRPALYATTFKFLDDLGLVSIADLPPLDGTVEPAPTPTADAVAADPDDPWEGEDPRIHPEEGTPEPPAPAESSAAGPPPESQEGALPEPVQPRQQPTDP